ncbi:MAG: CBS domain-containing protein [Nitriliruptorales bacterium]|nr:CBS domain-containing protein [Nitriliruptorales bacterium]
MSVPVSVILDRKGHDVLTTTPDETLLAVSHTLQEHNVGALVVSSGAREVEGVVSERDVVRTVARLGSDALACLVSDAMTSDVTTCDLATTVDELMAVMTQRRIRHVPVIEDGRLVGIVSIGDVVKARHVELELQAQALQEYVTGSRA